MILNLQVDQVKVVDVVDVAVAVEVVVADVSSTDILKPTRSEYS